MTREYKEWRKQREQERAKQQEPAHINEQLFEVLENSVETDEYLLGRITELDEELKVLHRLLRDFRLPPLEAWVPDKFYPAGSLTLCGGGLYQSRVATLAAPGHSDWQTVAACGEPGQDGRDYDDHSKRSAVIDLPSGFRLVERARKRGNAA